MTRRRWIVSCAAVGFVVLGVIWSRARGHSLVIETNGHINLGLPPFQNKWLPRWNWWLVPIGVAALVASVALSRERITLRLTVLGSTILTATWTALLAATGGWEGFTGHIGISDDYLPQLEWIRTNGWRSYFESFNNEALFSTFPTHVRSHPPGMVTLFGGLDSIGLSGPRWATVAVLCVAATIPLSIAVTVRLVAGRDLARYAAVLVAITPAAVFLGSTADALFAAVAAVAIALMAVATDRRSWPIALIAGVVSGGAITLTYGVVPLVAIMALALTLRPNPRSGCETPGRTRGFPSQNGVLLLAPMGVGVLAVLGTWALVGFNWFVGLSAVQRQYELDDAQQNRPFSYFVIANLVVFACVLGPTVIASVGAARRDRLLWIVGPAVVALAVADLSGLSKSEIERIWLPFVPWVTVAGAWLLIRIRKRWTWTALAAQIVTGVALQTLFFGTW